MDEILNTLQTEARTWCATESENVMDDEVIHRTEKIHDWRDYVPDSVKDMWHLLSERERFLVVVTANLSASNEEWE